MLKPCGCGYKIPSMRFYNRTIVLYRTNVHISHFIPQNHFRWNFSKRTAGESTGKVGTGQINSNEHHRQEAIKAISTSKTTSIASKVLFKKLAITHHSIPSINTPINPSSNPSSHPSWGAHPGRANAPGPGRSEEWHTKSHENICA